VEQLRGELRMSVDNRTVALHSVIPGSDANSVGTSDSNIENVQLDTSDQLFDTTVEPLPSVLKVVLPEDDPQFENEFNSCSHFEKECEEIIRLIQPRENQFEYRNSISSTLKKQITRSMNCPVLDISFHELKCFLPDDQIKLTVVLNQALLSTWHKIVYDRLLIISEQEPSITEADNSDEDTSATGFSEDITSFSSSAQKQQHSTTRKRNAVHKIKNIRLINESSIFKVVGIIDNIPFEIVANSRVDLCMLAFFEEVSSLVGRDHLLKRSVLLIRAWWNYESYNFSSDGKSPKELLPDFAIWLMITAIFNKYHNRISSPIEALFLFLTIYGNTFIGNHQAITLYGIRSFTDYSSNLTMWDDNNGSYHDNKEDLLIPPKLYEKYYQVVNIHGHPASSSASSAASSSMVSNDQGLYGPRIIKVDRCGWTVVHPFTYQSMTLEKLSNRKSEKIQLCFKSALASLQLLLQSFVKSSPMPSGNTNKSIMKTLFSETLKRVGSQNWRLDTFSVLGQDQGEDFDMEMYGFSAYSFSFHFTYFFLLV
jgi:hypothetical protein